MHPRKLEHGIRTTIAGIPYALLYGHDDNDVPTFWLFDYGMFQGFMLLFGDS